MAILSFNTKVHFGHGERAQLVNELKLNNIKRPLFVTDTGVKAAGVFAQAIESLGAIPGAVVFDQTPPNPTEDAVEACTATYHANQCDGIVGIGGGASLDLAKAVAALCGQAAPLWEYCNRHPQPRPITNAPPVIVMPTTSGTGSEVGRSAVIIFRNGIKAGIGCPSVVKAAICDPDLTIKLPPMMTAASGMDALAHCVETFCSPAINPPSDAIAMDGLKRIFMNIERAYEDGTDLHARWNMMMGALEGAICFQKGLGAVHSVSHALGALGHHHGTLNAIMLPHVLRVNAPHISDKMTTMATVLRMPADADIPSVFARLNERLGLPEGLSDLGIDASIFPAIAKAALADNAHKTNPYALTEADYIKLLNAAL
jgi:alcohol dehydrogenase class IV